jgi:hypothetical protein
LSKKNLKNIFFCVIIIKILEIIFKNMNEDLQVKAKQTDFEKMFDKISKARENCQKRIKDVI